MITLVKNISRLYTPVSNGEYGEVNVVDNPVLEIRDGLIGNILPADSANLPDAGQIIDAHGMCVLPGFVDGHTHPVFWHTRENEFIMRLQGKSYEEIAAAGGGIRNSARSFRNAGREEITTITVKRLARFFEYGTTTIEAKSGYGLSTRDEIKSLEIIRDLNNNLALEMVPTFLGAHEIPDEYRDQREKYIDLVINEMIPAVAEKKLARYCDVFCEKGVFDLDETRRILTAAAAYGLKARIHADELHPFGGAELAAELGALTADHLVEVSDAGITQMAERGVIPMLLPVTTFFLRKDHYAPARKMLAAGCQVAVATDFNPGSSMTQNMQLAWSVAALKMGMLPEELLWATTLVPARSLEMADSIGSIEPGKQADLVVMDIPNINYLPYHVGINHTAMTIKKGEVVFKRNDL